MADPVVTADLNELDQLAKQVLVDNDRGGYTVPSSHLYPFQWNWDSAFVALGWAEFDRRRAWEEVERLLAAQWPSGMVPHIVFWTEDADYFPGPDFWRANHGPVPSSGISQPPVVATIVRHLVERGGLDRAARLVEPIDRWHRWWHAARDPDGLGVVAVCHPWESGRDNLPDWDDPMACIDTSSVGVYQRRDTEVVDAGMRPLKHDYDRYLALVNFGAERNWDDAAISEASPFWVADPGCTAILLRAERDLMWMLQQLGADTGHVAERIDRMVTGFEKLLNPETGVYSSFDLRAERWAEAGTSASFLAPYAGITIHLDEICDELNAWAGQCDYLVPSFDPRHPKFEPNRYWRGPVWLVVNYMIATGLAEVGRGDLAASIKRSTRELIINSGFPESFSPATGQPVGGPHFSWTAALWLNWARHAYL